MSRGKTSSKDPVTTNALCSPLVFVFKSYFLFGKSHEKVRALETRAEESLRRDQPQERHSYASQTRHFQLVSIAHEKRCHCRQITAKLDGW